ncbi:MAG: MATE family efflux transporter [Brevinema sp.]
MPDKVKKFTEDNNIVKLLCILAFPTVVSGLVDSLYNTVDSIFIGRFVGNEGLAALSVINIIQLMYISIGVLFSVGNSSIVSRALGAQHPERAKSSLIHSFWSLFILSSTISLIILANLDSFLMLIGASERTLPYAKSYGGIILWTGFLLPINNMLMGAFRAKGEALRSTYLNILGASMNIMLDALFIIVFQLGVAGAAWATAISQGIIFILALRRVMKLYHTNLLLNNRSEISPNFIKEIVQVGTPTGIRLILFVGVYSVANVILVAYGDDYLSAFGVFNRLIMLLAMINISLSIGSQPLIGMNYGAKLYGRVREIIMVTLKVGMGVSLSASVFLWVAPASIYGIFTTDENIIKICQEISMHQSYTYIGWGIYICVAEALQAMGHAKESFWLSILYPLVVILCFIIFDRLWGLLGIFWAFPFSYLVVGVIAGIFLWYELNRLHKKNEALRHIF